MILPTHAPFIEALATFAKARGVQLYLVGGSVRDLLLNRPITDIDFALAGDAIQFAKAFAEHIDGTFIAMEEHPPTARVVVKTLSLDFAQFRAASLLDDLRLRDLTINAMAISLNAILTSKEKDASLQSIFTGKQAVIDPCSGMGDLAACQLQFPSEQVIQDDPLRLMRIYRFAAQLGFKISQNATNLIQKYHHLLPDVSTERTRDELMKILATQQAYTHLQKMFEVQLLQHIFVPTGWAALEIFEACPIPKAVCVYQTKIEDYLSGKLGSEVSRRSLIKLCLLLQGEIGNVAKRLRLSRKATRFMKCIASEHQQLTAAQLGQQEIIRFLQRTGAEWWGVLLFSTTLHRLTDSQISRIADIYYQHFLPILKQGRLITGKDLMRTFNLKEGKEIGMLLKQIEERQFNGEIRTREEAFATAKTLIRLP